MSDKTDSSTSDTPSPEGKEKAPGFSPANKSISPKLVSIQQNQVLRGVPQASVGIGVQVHSGPLPPPNIWNQYPPESKKFWMERVAKSQDDAHQRAVQAQQDTVDVNKDGRRMGFRLVLWLGGGILAILLLLIVLTSCKVIDQGSLHIALQAGIPAIGVLAGATVIQAIIKGGNWRK